MQHLSSEHNISGATLRVTVAPHLVHWVEPVMLLVNGVISFGVNNDIDPY